MEYGLHNIVISGLKAARKANDVLGIFKEEAVSSGKPHHSYYEPETPSPTSNIPSYFSNLTANLPKKANSVKVQNLRSDQVILPTLITSANALNMMIPMLYDEPHPGLHDRVEAVQAVWKALGRPSFSSKQQSPH